MSYVAAGAGGNDVLLRKQIILRSDFSATAVSTFYIADQLPENILLRVTPTITAGSSISANAAIINLFEYRLYNAFSSNTFYDATVNGSGTYGQFIPLGWSFGRVGGALTNSVAFETVTCGSFNARIISGGQWILEVWNVNSNAQATTTNMSSVVVCLDIRAGGDLKFEN